MLLEVIGLSNPYFRCFKYLAVALVKSALINQLEKFSKSKADREFLLYPVCLGLTFYSCFYAKISPSMPDLSACYECARLWSPIEHAFHLKHRACARGMSIESIFIWKINWLKYFHFHAIVMSFHFANLTNIHTIQVF